ncbi:MAG: hypothetical protein M0005_02055 [Actinomycetota bacterium]|jgi:hypothetical protein|nr:hypothetical protein [Actinomycetota bacterium]
MNQNPGRSGGGFLRILGIVYLVEIIRRHRERRHPNGPEDRGAN